MQDKVEVSGMIIKSMPIGDYDKRLTLLTLEHGKLSAFARGARRPKSVLLGISRIFSFGKFYLYEGRDSYSLQAADISAYFDEISMDIEKSGYAGYFAELADYYSKEFLKEPDLLKLLYLSFKALLKPSIPDKLIRRIFELRCMVIAGEYDIIPTKEVSETTVYTWNYICTSSLDKLYTFNVKEEVIKELEDCLDDAVKRYIDKELKSLSVLEALLLN